MLSFITNLSDTKILILFGLLIVLIIIFLVIISGNIDFLFRTSPNKKANAFSQVKIDDTLNQEFYHLPESSTLWVLIPYLGEKIGISNNLKEDIVDRGFSYLHYQFPREILSSDYGLTINNFNNINDLIIEDIRKVKEEYEFSEIHIMGASVGTSNLFTVVNNNSDLFTKVVAIVPGNSLAECTWKGISSQNIRKGLEKQNINLPFLEEQWKDFAPQSNFENLKDKKLYIYLSKADKVIPYVCATKLVELLRQNDIPFTLKENKYLGHYGTVYNAYFNPDFLDDEKQESEK